MTVEGLEPCGPESGTFAMDGRDGRVGRVTDQDGPDVQLRPPDCGAEWDGPPEAVRPASPGLVLSAKVWGGQPVGAVALRWS